MNTANTQIYVKIKQKDHRLKSIKVWIHCKYKSLFKNLVYVQVFGIKGQSW